MSFDHGARTAAEAQVLVIGAGRLGAAVVSGLAAAGVGTIAVIDERAALLDVAADAATRAAPGATVIRHRARFVDANSFELLLDADLVIDTSRDSATRYLANDAAAIQSIPMIWGSATADGGEVGVAWDDRGVDYRDLHPESREDSGNPQGQDGEPDAAAPVPQHVLHATATAIVDCSQRLLSGDGDGLAGQLIHYDARTMQSVERRYRRDPDAARPGSLEERTALREPDPERSITPVRLARLLAGPTTAGIHETPPILLDVREAPEASFVSLPGSVLIPLGQLPERLGELDPTASIVVYCHHGVRSARALELLEKAGFTRVRHLTGGIDAWRVQVAPTMPAY